MADIKKEASPLLSSHLANSTTRQHFRRHTTDASDSYNRHGEGPDTSVVLHDTHPLQCHQPALLKSINTIKNILRQVTKYKVWKKAEMWCFTISWLVE